MFFSKKKTAEWWKERVVYQIYPRSFCDSNDDGIGDILGIISKLDYLAELGIGIIWLSPVYCSPNDDNGYDISDYCGINPEFGTMKDMKRLISEAKKRDIKIIMDLVINHTSDEHRWFQESRKSIDNPYRDYYFWRKGKEPGMTEKRLKKQENELPNNWTSFFTGPAWQYDELTGEYYLHLFSKKQPDLNWYNPRVYDEIKKILKFWLDAGIAGFRCDVINVIYKTTLSDGIKRLALTGREHYVSQEGCHIILKELRKEVFSKYDCFTVGETVMVTPAMANDLCAPERGELDMVFGFEHMETDQINNKWFKKPFDADDFTRVLTKWQTQVGWNANYFENHDQPRSVSRFGDDGIYRIASAKMMALLLLTLRGTPYIYEGQEIGMTNGDFKSLDEIEDIDSHNVDAMARSLHFPAPIRWNMIKKTSRDNARTPMQWDSSQYAGFSHVRPWLKINANYKYINAEDEKHNPDSILSFYKKMIRIRAETPSLIFGTFCEIVSAKKLYAFERELTDSAGCERCITVINFSPVKRRIPETVTAQLTGSVLLISNYRRTSLIGLKELEPFEALLAVSRSI